MPVGSINRARARALVAEGTNKVLGGSALNLFRKLRLAAVFDSGLDQGEI